MIELLFLLLPIAVVYGWYIGQKQVKDTLENNSINSSKQFVRGIKFLLQDKDTDASKIFVDLLNIDEKNLDANLALAEVYRSKSDYDKAIKIHKKLLDLDISYEKKKLVILELSKDYISVSLHTHALELLDQLIDDPRYQNEVIKLIIKIRQVLGDWDEALSLIDKYREFLHDDFCKTQYSQFLCELAQKATFLAKYDNAKKLLDKSLENDPLCVRASLLYAQILIENSNDIPNAKSHLDNILRQESQMIFLALPMLRKCYDLTTELNSYISHLIRWFDKSHNYEIALEIAKIYSNKSIDSANKFLLEAINYNPSIFLFNEILNFQKLLVKNQEIADNISILQKIVLNEIGKRPFFVCKHCGFSTKSIFWRCPKCSSWATLKPITNAKEYTPISK